MLGRLEWEQCLRVQRKPVCNSSGTQGVEGQPGMHVLVTFSAIAPLVPLHTCTTQAPHPEPSLAALFSFVLLDANTRKPVPVPPLSPHTAQVRITRRHVQCCYIISSEYSILSS